MQIYVINLARATERRAQMQLQADKLGLNFSFLTATDGRSLSEQDRQLVDHDRRKSITIYPLTDNEIGCWISHRRAMQALIDSGETMAAVVEDDAVLSDNFPAILKAIERLSITFDVVDLHRNFKKTEVFLVTHPLIEGCSLGRIGYTHMNATAYVMSREGALKFLKYAPRFAHAVDKEMHRYWANGLNMYGLERPVAVQDDRGYSYIDETRGQNRPSERMCYPDADGIYWKIRRRWTQISDSIQKRLAFAAYRYKAKKLF